MSLHILSTVVLAAHWLIVVGLSLRVISRRSPVGTSVAWIAVMFSLPFLGAGAYLLFGEKRLGRHRAQRAEKLLRELGTWQETLADEDPGGGLTFCFYPGKFSDQQSTSIGESELCPCHGTEVPRYL